MQDVAAYSDLQIIQLTMEAFRLSIEDQQFKPRIWLRAATEAHRYLRRGQAEMAFGIGSCVGLLLEGRWKAAWKAGEAMLSGWRRRGMGFFLGGGGGASCWRFDDGGGDGETGRRMSAGRTWDSCLAFLLARFVPMNGARVLERVVCGLVLLAS